MKKPRKLMITTIPITQARINLGQVVKRVHLEKEYVILEKDGIPIAGMMNIDEFEDYLELQDPAAQRAVQASRADVKAGRTRPATELLAELQAANLSPKKRGKA